MRRFFSKALIISFIFIYGCAEDTYGIEKQYYSALKKAEQIFKNPHASPPNELKKVVDKLNGFALKYPKSNLAIDADFTIARLYVVKEDYAAARNYLTGIIKKYAQSQPVCSEAVFLIGNSYEIENKWDSALIQYKKIMHNYPRTIRGINIPIYIIQHYKIKFEPDKMTSAVKEAIGYYTELSEKYPGSLLEFRCRSLTAECFILLKDWQNAIQTIETIIVKFKDKIKMDGALMQIASIYNNGLKDDRKAKETLEKLIRDYPKSRLIGKANDMLKSSAVLEENAGSHKSSQD